MLQLQLEGDSMKTKTIPSTTLIAFVAASLIPPLAAAQIPNPFQAAKDAYNKAKQQVQSQVQTQLQQQAQHSTTAVTSTATSAPAATPASQPGAASVSQPYYTLCRYQGQQDGHPVVYVAPIIHTDHGASDISMDFNKFMKTNYDIAKIQQGGGYCRTVSNSPDQQAYTMDQLDKQWAASKTVVTRLSWTDSPGEIAAANAKLSAAAAAASAATAGGPYISCSTGSGPGVDTYFTGVFQTTRPIKHMPNGASIVDPSILSDFHAYLKQKGYNFKPGSNGSCDVKATEEATKTAQHLRAYGGNGGLGVNCCGNGKVVETGWKITP